MYRSLEEFFLRQGYRSDADQAFIAGKRRERKEKLHGLDWLGSYLLDWLVGYGRHPWQAGIPCAVFIALGCVLFSPKKMEPQKPEDVARVYSRFWYSLGLFLPFVDLQADKVWKPKADQTFLRNYMRVHIMLGWILVPLVLAALTGLINNQPNQGKQMGSVWACPLSFLLNPTRCSPRLVEIPHKQQRNKGRFRSDLVAENLRSLRFLS